MSAIDLCRTMSVRVGKIPGWFWMVLSSFLFSATGALVAWQVTELKTNIFWLGWGRFLFGFLVMLLPSFFGTWSLVIHNRRAFILRGLYGSSGQFLLFVAVAMVGLGRGTALSYLLCVVGTVSGIWILKEKPTAILWGAVIAALVGVMLCCEAGVPRGAEWFALGCAFFSGITLPYIRLLRRTDTNQVVYYSQGIFGTLLLTPMILFFPPPISLLAVGMIFLTGLTDTLAQLCMNQGMSSMPVARSSAMIMLSPVFSLLAGVIVFDEPLSLRQWTGAVMVLAAALIAVRARMAKA